MYIFQIITAFIMSAISFVFGIFGLPMNKQNVDMDKFVLVWSDEFDGDSLDSTKWQPLHGNTERAVMRKGGYLHKDLVEVKEGNLHIYTRYYEDGLGGGKPGYYSQILLTRDLYEQKYGYFEVRCILPKGAGQWSAFWMNSHTYANVDSSGRDGAEIDIFESPYYHRNGLMHNYISQNVHIDGYGEDLKSCKLGVYPANNPYDEYNTYGLEWNENEYIFYVNGKETSRTSFGGTSQTPQYMILSVEVGGANGVPDKSSWAGDMNKNDCIPSEFIVDYVRAYQYK